MNAVAMIQFDEEEVSVFRRALQGHESAIVLEARSRKEEEYRPIRAMLNRISQVGALQGAEEERAPGEAFDAETLHEFQATLLDLHERYEPETTAAYWRRIGAPGADDAVEGLALQRRETLRQVGECRVILALAIDLLERTRSVTDALTRISAGVAPEMAG